MSNSTFKFVADSISEHPPVLNANMKEPEDCGYASYNSNTKVVRSYASVDSLLLMVSENDGKSFNLNRALTSRLRVCKKWN